MKFLPIFLSLIMAVAATQEFSIEARDPEPNALAGMGRSCKTNRDCPKGMICKDKFCQIKRRPEGPQRPRDVSSAEIDDSDEDLETLIEARSPSCKRKSDCPKGKVCKNKLCVKADLKPRGPKRPRDVDSTEIADDDDDLETLIEARSPGCKSNSDCPKGKVCKHKLCVKTGRKPRGTRRS